MNRKSIKTKNKLKEYIIFEIQIEIHLLQILVRPKYEYKSIKFKVDLKTFYFKSIKNSFLDFFLVPIAKALLGNKTD